MAEILAVGITHYPPLAGRDEVMAWMLANRHLPEQLRHAGNWPTAMRQGCRIDKQ